MNFWKNITRSVPAKIFWWLTAAAALFAGALCCGYVLLAVDVGCFDRQTNSYWDTTNAKNAASRLAQNMYSHIEDSGWGEREPIFYNEERGDMTFVRFQLYEIDESGVRTGTIYDTVPGDEDLLPLYRISLLADGTKAVDSAYSRWEYLADQVSHTYDAPAVDTGTDTPVPYDPADRGIGPNKLAPVRVPQVITPPADVKFTDRLVLDIYVDERMLLNAPESAEQDRSYYTWAENNLSQGFIAYMMLDAAAEVYLLGIVISAVVGLLAVVMLLFGMGRKIGSEGVSLCWYDKIPMEFQLGGLILLAQGCYLVMHLGYDAVEYYYLHPFRFTQAFLYGLVPGTAAIAAGYGLLILVCLGSLIRWGKTGHPLHCCWSLRILSKSARWLWYLFRDTIPLAYSVFGALLAVFVLNFFLLLGGADGNDLATVLWFALWIAVAVVVLQICRCLHSIQVTLKAYAAGNYEARPHVRSRIPALHRMSDDLAHVGDGMNAAVEQRMKSERFKTELITNVSHDLKTPLTSIINYTDLLRKEPLGEKAAEYAEVLARQGEKLRKLTEDLVQASKATSGVLSCTKVPTDLAELCQQAVAEYADRLEAAGLTPVLSLPETDYSTMLDGNLTWRIIDNLLSNACKYAQPGTRLYLTGRAGQTSLTLEVKNISREALNVEADALMERFVRGDSARSTEGSGLGLAVARSLTELQGGSFSLSIDGDLFKAKLAFPREIH